MSSDTTYKELAKDTKKRLRDLDLTVTEFAAMLPEPKSRPYTSSVINGKYENPELLGIMRDKIAELEQAVTT